jgi:hypothetical protein
MMQGRVLLAKLLWSFDLELRNGDEVDWERDCRLYSLWQKPPVYVKFKPVDGVQD